MIGIGSRASMPDLVSEPVPFIRPTRRRVQDDDHILIHQNHSTNIQNIELNNKLYPTIIGM
jgi:hypothetical protein